MKLDNTIAVITGAGRGIGEAIALAFAREGADLVLASRTESELQGVAEQVRKAGRQVQIVTADVSVEADAQRIAQAALDAYGRIDVLVNAAGIYGPIGLTWDVDVEHWVRAIQINLIGTLYCCRAVLPHMIERKQGKIVNYSGGGQPRRWPASRRTACPKRPSSASPRRWPKKSKTWASRSTPSRPCAVATVLQNEVLAAGEAAGPLFERMKRLLETGEGGVPRELPAELTVYLASEASSPLTGKLVAAPYDGWQNWTPERIEELMAKPWFTLRRMDEVTIRPLLADLSGGAS